MLVLLFRLCVKYGECVRHIQNRRGIKLKGLTLPTVSGIQSALESIPYKQEARLFSDSTFGKTYLLSIRSTFNSPLLYNPTFTEFINEYKIDINGTTTSMVGRDCLASRGP